MIHKFSELKEEILSLPQIARFGVVGIFGVLSGWITYEIIYWINPFVEFKATVSLTLAWILGVPRQHALHRWLTFTFPTSYWNSLWKAYLSYSSGAIASISVNLWIVEGIGVHHRLGWLFSTICGVGFNYIGLRFFAFATSDEVGPE